MKNIKLDRLKSEIQEIKKEIQGLGDMRPGSLSKQARKSTTEYGEYWHLSYTHRGKGRTQYIRNEFLDQIKNETENFRRFKELSDQLIGLSIELSQIRLGKD